MTQRTVTGRRVTDGRPLRLTFDATIAAVTPVEAADSGGDRYIAPGWIDLQVNGFGGVDYNSADTSIEDIARSMHVACSTGVTRLYPTVITGEPSEMWRALANLARAKTSRLRGAAIEGFHVEGPHISPEDGPRGAHPRQWVRPPDVEEYRRWQDATGGQIRLVTLAPEWPGATAYIQALVADGVVVSIGHTAATGAQIADAVSAGATMSTHIGNGAHRILPRHPNYIWDQLADDRLSASVIVDGIHLPASFLKAAVRAKGVSRTVLVTDASAPAGARPGRYWLGAQPIDLTPDGRVVLAGQDRLAGSALRMDRAIGNVIAQAGISLADAVAMATTNPARVGRLGDRTGGLAAGDRADLVLFSYDETSGVRVHETYVDGELVWGNGQ